MSDKQFVLSTPFSLYNETVVLTSTDDSIVFGLLDCENEELKGRLSKAVTSFFRSSGKTGSCEFVRITREQFEHVASLQYGLSSDGSRAKRLTQGSESLDTGSGYHAAVLLLDSLLDDARRQGATDIHIEENRVRFRMNGILRHVCNLAPERSSELVRRIKMLAKLDVLGGGKGQDGQFSVSRHAEAGERLSEEGQLFVRVSIIPVLSAQRNGVCESVVLRLLDPARVPLDFAALGFSRKQCSLLHQFAALKNGIVLLCGSTGAGKSTTAAALLTEIAGGGKRKIITLEDPPEYLLKGVSQIAMDSHFGMDFSDALPLVFRQDPDVIFIGEVRNEKTARTAIQAAVTGHLVFATMHTGGFYETMVRLRQLGADAKDIATVLRGIIVQELECSGKNVSLHARILRISNENAWALCGAEKSADIEKIIQEAVI